MKRFLFSTKADLAAQSVLKGLAQAHLATVVTYAVVITEDDQVAALLEKLDTAEQIVSWDAVEHVLTPAIAPEMAATTWKPGAEKAVQAEIAEQKKDKRHYRYNSGEKVECPQCHNKVSPMFMLKDGSQCKICSMKAKKAAKSQPAEKSQPHSAMPPKPDFGHEDNLSNIRVRKKEKIDLSKLAGVKVG